MSFIQAAVRRDGAALRHALLLSLGPAVGQGFGRFAYALLLVPMQVSLGWSYAQAGAVTSANALGYLCGALGAGPAVARWGAPQVVRLALLGISLSLIATGLTQGFLVLLVLRFLAGLGGGLLFLGGATVVLQAGRPGGSDMPLALYYAGPGVGIALSGLLVPLLLGPPLSLAWPAAWVGMGLGGLLALLLVNLALRQAARTEPPVVAGPAAPRLFAWRDYRALWPTLLAYMLFGLGYIGYMTFVVAFMQSMQVAGPVVQSFWVLLGVCAACSGLIWGPIAQRLAGHHALALILFTLSAGAALPLLALNRWSFALSALLFGSTFVSIVTPITRQVRQAVPRERWTAVLGNATALFAVGQLCGPVITGFVADLRGGLVLGLLGSAALLALAALVVLLGPKPGRVARDA